MNGKNRFIEALSGLAGDGLDLALGALGSQIKEQFALPNRQPSGLPFRSGFRCAVHEFAEEVGHEALWKNDGTLAVLTMPHAGYRWQVVARDYGNVVEVALPTALRYIDGQVPAGLAIYLLTCSARVPFGGFDLYSIDNCLMVRCRSTIPTAVVTGKLLCTVIEIQVAEVADIYSRIAP
jgi:hypothetical protein